MTKGARRSTIIISLIIVLAAVLRFYGLARESLWLDEALSLKVAEQGPLFILIQIAFDNHPPLYLLILHFWIKIFGPGVYALRALSAIFGTAAVYLIYRLSRAIFKEKTAILSSALFALSIFQVFYSQEARMYILLALLTLASVYSFIKLLDGPPGRRQMLFYIISSMLLLYTHYSAITIILVQNIYFLIRYMEDREHPLLKIKDWLLSQAAILLLYMPLILAGLSRSIIVKTKTTIFPKSYPLIESLIGISGSALLAAIFFGAILYYLLRTFKARRETNSPKDRSFFVLLWLVIPVALTYIFYKFVRWPFDAKYFMVSAPALFILAAYSVNLIKKRFIRNSVIIAAIILSLAQLAFYYNDFNRMRWDAAALYIEKTAMPGDLVLFNDKAGSRSVFDYYFKRKDVTEALISPKCLKLPFVGIDRETVEDLKTQAAGRGRVWVVLSNAPDIDRLIEKTMGADYTIAEHKIFGSVYYVNRKIKNIIEIFLLVKK
ncbi:MAG: glycosyltransferase family 39 protein [Candidatus Omnitrophica bacterium]|nr:glycosyltransferase family 39 protein [Candidatus Omnitrophota bacterium]